MAKDIRIIKTENKLKEALLDIIIEKDFNSITIKELCLKSKINRITFYKHYKDKYELLNDIFNDMYDESLNNLPKREKINNVKKDPYKTISNYLYFFVEAINKRINLIISISKNLSGYIYFAFENFFQKKFKEIILNSNMHSNLKYNLDQTVSFINGGIINFIIKGVQQAKYNDFESIFFDAKKLFINILKSNLLYNE